MFEILSGSSAASGFSYDWSREINTTDPDYFRWTQWIFKQLFKRGLAYVEDKPVWFCPELGTVLANEEVLTTPEGPRSERGHFRWSAAPFANGCCGSPTTQKD